MPLSEETVGGINLPSTVILKKKAQERPYLYNIYGRLLRRDTTHNNTVFTETFNYHTTASGAPTSQVANVQIVGGDYNITYSYTYDDNGNILFISDGTNITTYAYDSANQLTRENNQAAGKTWTWTYDDAGNITAKKEYNYTTGTLGTVLDTIEYTYGNTNWGDMLTGYGDNTIRNLIFSGNPFMDGTWTYAWEHGRELMRMTGSGKTITFEYNADGLRVSKRLTVLSITMCIPAVSWCRKPMAIQSWTFPTMLTAIRTRSLIQMARFRLFTTMF